MLCQCILAGGEHLCTRYINDNSKYTLMTLSLLLRELEIVDE